MKIAVLERNSVGTDIDVTCFEDFGEVTYYRNTVAADAAEKVKDVDIIIANKAPMNEETLKDAPNVKLICEFATGFDNIDLEYCKKRRIKVANVKDYSTAAVAQHTFALALYLLEHLPHYDTYVKDGSYGAQDRFSNFDIRTTAKRRYSVSQSLQARHGELSEWVISAEWLPRSQQLSAVKLFFIL